MLRDEVKGPPAPPESRAPAGGFSASSVARLAPPESRAPTARLFAAALARLSFALLISLILTAGALPALGEDPAASSPASAALGQDPPAPSPPSGNPGQDTAAPGQDTAAPSQDTAAPSQDIAAPTPAASNRQPQTPPISAPGAQAFLEARHKLLSASSDDLAHGYEAQLDKVIILGYQAARRSPEDPAVWRLLGRLSETKALFAGDPLERRRLMAEAREHFGRSAALEKAAEADSRDRLAPKEPPAYSDPYLNELFWSGRLSRGEVTLEELERRYKAEGVEPLHRSELWSDRLHLLRAGDPAKKAAELERAREDFEGLWAEMPVEVPWPGPGDRFGPPKLKKVEVLAAWATTLASLSTLEAPEARRPLFEEAISLYPRALALPLDRFETAALIGRLDRADELAPDAEALAALWEVKDRFYELLTGRLAEGDPAVWLARGEEAVRRADRQTDERVFRFYLDEAEVSLERYASLTEPQAAACHEWGRRLEGLARTGAGPAVDDLSAPSSESLYRLALPLSRAAERYRRAHELEPLSPLYARSMGRILLKLAALGEALDFPAAFEESRRLAAQAINADPDPGQAWFERGADLLGASRLAPLGPIPDRLLAEALAAFRQCLSGGNDRVERLRAMADLVWRAAERSPAHQRASLALLVEVCARLVALGPEDPDHRFARSLALLSLLSATPDWPDDRAFGESQYARELFTAALSSFQEGLELLSRSSLTPGRPMEDQEGEVAEAPLSLWPFPDSRGGDDLGDPAPSLATFRERLATILNRQLDRLLTVTRPEILPTWYKLRLAGFFRRLGSTGYPPPEDRMALYRLAGILLLEAETGPLDRAAGRSDLAAILSERGLLMAEMSLLAKDDADYLLAEAQRLWTGAEAASPGSSRYARARWAAWGGDAQVLGPLLRHTAEQQDRGLWPSYQEAANEPALAPHHGRDWFKSAWFGYDR